MEFSVRSRNWVHFSFYVLNNKCLALVTRWWQNRKVTKLTLTACNFCLFDGQNWLLYSRHLISSPFKEKLLSFKHRKKVLLETTLIQEAIQSYNLKLRQSTQYFSSASLVCQYKNSFPIMVFLLVNCRLLHRLNSNQGSDYITILFFFDIKFFCDKSWKSKTCIRWRTDTPT